MVYAFWHVEESKWVTLNLADVQKRRDRLKVRPTHESLDDIREEIRWEELSWDKVRRAQMRWSVGCEECSVKCGAWRMQCEVWSVKEAVRSEKCEVWTVKCGLWSVKCEVWSVKCEVWIGKSAVWSEKCEVCTVECEECREKCEVRSGASNVTFAECTHARAWLAHGACKFYRWERSYISLRQLPPRLVRVLLVYANIYIYIKIN